MKSLLFTGSSAKRADNFREFFPKYPETEEQENFKKTENHSLCGQHGSALLFPSLVVLSVLLRFFCNAPRVRLDLDSEQGQNRDLARSVQCDLQEL